MTEVQIISRILNNKSTAILTVNGIDIDYFSEIYKEELQFILDHEKEYGNVPDKETFIAKFNDFDILEVAEGDKYLVETLAEEHNYNQLVNVINKAADLIQGNSWEAVNYVREQLPNLIKKAMPVGQDIISTANERLELYEKTKNNKDLMLLPTGFEELDQVIGGLAKGEELVVMFARTGSGKTFVLMKMLQHLWKMNKRVGLLEPEMTANKIGYRFDSLNANISNYNLTKGKDVENYVEYVENLKQQKIPFFVAHPRDFKRKVTVSKLKSFVESNHLDILAIDGISYLTDQRAVRGDNRTTMLTQISEDLMDLSIELGIPVIVITQSNRTIEKGADLELENIRDSDGIAYNASLVISVQQKENQLQLAIKKNRNGVNNVKLSYDWKIDTGEFTFIAKENESETRRKRNNDEDERF